MKTVVVVGNPKPKSRTADAAIRVIERLLPAETAGPEVIDVVDLGPSLLGWGDAGVKAAVATVQAADVVVFASPTYKASYTGLLKTFLDQFAGGTGLAGVIAIPLMLGAGPGHQLAPELLLKPVLVELGGICLTAALFQLDSQYTDDPGLDVWIDRWAPVVATYLKGKAL